MPGRLWSNKEKDILSNYSSEVTDPLDLRPLAHKIALTNQLDRTEYQIYRKLRVIHGVENSYYKPQKQKAKAKAITTSKEAPATLGNLSKYLQQKIDNINSSIKELTSIVSEVSLLERWAVDTIQLRTKLYTVDQNGVVNFKHGEG